MKGDWSSFLFVATEMREMRCIYATHSLVKGRGLIKDTGGKKIQV